VANPEHVGRDRQIAHHALEALLIGVVILPAREVTDVWRAAQTSNVPWRSAWMRLPVLTGKIA
jgi:hypothetical protein